MTYLDYIVFFEKCDQRRPLSGNATRLYLKLLAISNSIGWPKEGFARSDAYVAAVCGFAENTMRDCRIRLVEQGLLATIPGKMGRGATTVYQLLDSQKGDIKDSKFDTLSENKGANSDTLPPNKDSNFDTIVAAKDSNSEPLIGDLDGKGSAKGSKIEVPYIDKEKEESRSASASSALDSSLSKPAPKKPKSKGATHEEIAALHMPFDGEEFAQVWLTFYTTNTKQVGKPLTAFDLMLKKLGKRPEGFAIAMLEAAIQGDWSGVENGGTARAFTEWQTEQARNPTPVQTATPFIVPELNHEFLAQQQAASDAAFAEHLAEFAAT